jgi:phosphoglycerate dehydrogenase-like enzyme
VLIFDPFVNDRSACDADVELVSLPALIEASDVVVLCAASNEGTHHLFGRDQISGLLPGSVFVNVARAALVDTDALVERLRRGDIRAAIDVFD